ncbi:unnamed protein product [marine sediment metagenome]|uniref:Uncharacterized protein n=1 Tax=marine sediment metagenome TaxID=412755 RepID=X1C0C0_9ZZZZ
MRTRTDEELQAIIDTYNESELTGLMFALLPASKTPDDLTGLPRGLVEGSDNLGAEIPLRRGVHGPWGYF